MSIKTFKNENEYLSFIGQKDEIIVIAFFNFFELYKNYYKFNFELVAQKFPKVKFAFFSLK